MTMTKRRVRSRSSPATTTAAAASLTTGASLASLLLSTLILLSGGGGGGGGGRLAYGLIFASGGNGVNGSSSVSNGIFARSLADVVQRGRGGGDGGDGNGGGGGGENNNIKRARKVLVTGASGRTGQLVFQALSEHPDFDPPVAMVRSEASGKKLRKSVPSAGLDQIVVCDVGALAREQQEQRQQEENDDADDDDDGGEERPFTSVLLDSIPSEIGDCDAMIICTSAVPQISKISLLRAMVNVPLNLIRRRKAFDFRSLRFVWKKNQSPELVDYRGQVAQIDLARKLNMKHVVIVSSMGGTDPSNFLNDVGKNPKTGEGDGDILLWKRRAEKYLIDRVENSKSWNADGRVSYSIIHPGGLVDSPPVYSSSPSSSEDDGDGNNKKDDHDDDDKEIVLDVDDKLMKNKKQRSISRGDVANLCVASLTVGYGRRLSFDCVARRREEPRDQRQTQGDGGKTGADNTENGGGGRGNETATTTSTTISASLKHAEEALSKFIQESKVYDYAM